MIHMPDAPAILRQMSALSDATRGRLLRLLERHELTVAELCSVLQLPQSTTSRHLKVLGDEGWVVSRREGTAALYRMLLDDLPLASRKLWLLVREQLADTAAAEQDDRRIQQVLADRQSKSEAFFASEAGKWDHHRSELFGDRFDLQALPALLEPTWTVGDLGCGTGQIAEAVAPFVQSVVAVDSSSAMLKAARKRLGRFDNATVRRGDVVSLPIDDDELDAASLMLVLHHLNDPQTALTEAARVLRPGGRLLLVDMLPHDHHEYQQMMGHVWMGFDRAQLEPWLEAAGLEPLRFTPLPVDPKAKGPALFAAVARCGERVASEPAAAGGDVARH